MKEELKESPRRDIQLKPAPQKMVNEEEKKVETEPQVSKDGKETSVKE